MEIFFAILGAIVALCITALMYPAERRPFVDWLRVRQELVLRGIL